MPGGTGVAYLTEEARLEAQRRMLEKFGLRDSETDESEADDGGCGGGADGGEVGKAGGAVCADPGVAEKVAEELKRAESDAAAVSPAAKPAEQNGQTVPVRKGDDLWPGLLLSDPTKAASLPAVYHYRSADHVAATSQRECRVTQITMYQSLYQEVLGRKIAVDDRLICYAVGGHIRVLGRGSTQRTLLKGHQSGVCDMAFASLAPPQPSEPVRPTEHVAVLGSVAEDGTVFIWKLRRDDSVVDDADGPALPILEKADCVRLEHPDPGQFYQRVMFRPSEGAALSKNGLGVAVLLLDTLSPHLRITELVKIGDRSRVLDRALRDGHKCEHGVGLAAATWLTNEMVATARGHEVCLWSVKDSKNMVVTGTLPRSENSLVSSLHVLQRGAGFVILLVVADQGRCLELWSVMAEKPSMLVQKLLIDEGLESFNVVVHDMHAPEFVVVSSLRQKFMLVIHYRQDRACFDAITQLPVKQPVLSMCLTKDRRRIVADNERGLPEASDMEELGVWCVQPSNIQMMHVSASSCKPFGENGQSTTRATSEKEEALKHAEKTKEPSNDAKCLDEAKGASPVKAKDAKGTPKKSAPVGPGSTPAVPEMKKKDEQVGIQDKGIANGSSAVSAPAKVVQPKLLLKKKPVGHEGTTTEGGHASENAGKDDGGDKAASGKGVVAARSAQWEAKSNGPPDTPETTPTKNTRGTPADAQDASPTSASSVARIPSKAGMTAADVDEIVATVAAAAKKVAADFDNEGVKHAEVEIGKIDGLVASVRQNAVANLDKLVSDALRKPMTEAILPVASEMITTSSARADAAAAAAVAAANASVRASRSAGSSKSAAYFGEAFKSAGLGPSFAAACDEMGGQASSAIKDSMSRKYGALVGPSVNSVQEAVQDLRSAMSEFVERVKVSVAKANELASDSSGGKRNVREVVASLVEEENLTEAFAVALESGELDVIVELCSDLDVCSFFDTYMLPQSSVLALARQLGQKLEIDAETKLAWLEELMLVLEPADAEIAATAPAALQELHGNMEALRRNKDVMEAHPHLVKKAKMLSLLIASQDG